MVLCESGQDLALTRTLFLRICAACYSMAFISLYPQISGLYGPQGLLPVHSMLKITSLDPWELVKSKPTLLWFSGQLGLSPDLMMDLICLLGTFLAFFMALYPSYGNKVSFVILWIFYQSLYQVSKQIGVTYFFRVTRGEHFEPFY